MNLATHVLLPIDFSDSSTEALDYALALAEKLGARVTLMHAYETPLFGYPEGAFITPEVATQMASSAQSALEAVAAQHAGRGVSVVPFLHNGDPRDGIVNVARELHADLIVMGTHGRRGIARALLGSVAEHVVRTAPCPVLTVRTKTVA